MTKESTSKLMKGFPPDPANMVTLENWRRPPFNRWGFTHVRELIPSASIPCEPRKVQEFETAALPLDGFEITHEGERQNLEQWLARTHTDSFVVLKNGKVAFEYYAPGNDAVTPHIWMSVSKSLLGLASGIAADKGYLDVDAPVVDIIPETKDTAYEDATVRELLDMRAGIDFDENYTTSDGMMAQYRTAHLWGPLSPGETLGDMRSFFSRFTERAGKHGGRFLYISPNTDLLGWILERATGTRFCDFVSETIWKPMGAERDGYITVDRLGAPRTGGGMCGTTRDLARLGRLIATGGSRDGTQIVPRAWIDDIVNNGDPAAWKEGDFFDLFEGADIHYRSKWYVLREPDPLVFGFGVFGQGIFVDPHRDVVIAKNSSQPVPLDKEYMSMTLKGIHALRAILVR